MLFHSSSSAVSLNTLYLWDFERSSAEGNTSGLLATVGSLMSLSTMSLAPGTGLTYQMKSASWAAIFGSYAKFMNLMASTGCFAFSGMHWLSVHRIPPSVGMADLISPKPSPPKLLGAEAMNRSPDHAWVMIVSPFSRALM